MDILSIRMDSGVDASPLTVAMILCHTSVTFCIQITVIALHVARVSFSLLVKILQLHLVPFFPQFLIIFPKSLLLFSSVFFIFSLCFV